MVIRIWRCKKLENGGKWDKWGGHVTIVIILIEKLLQIKTELKADLLIVISYIILLLCERS